MHLTIRSGTNRSERYGRSRGFSCSSHWFAAVHIRRVQDRPETDARLLPSSAGSATGGLTKKGSFDLSVHVMWYGSSDDSITQQ